MIRRIVALSVLAVASQVSAADAVEDKSAKVTATIVVPAEVAAYDGLELELRLYEYDPFLADAGATLVEKVNAADRTHEAGKETQQTVVLGAKAKRRDDRRYYVTAFLLKDGKRLLMGEKDGKRGLGKVLESPKDNTIRLVARDLR